jgi:hypothetical protein
MSILFKTRLKVLSVSSVQDPEDNENIKVTFVEERTRTPMVAMVPQNVPKEISSVVFQVQEGIQKAMPQGLRNIQFQKIVLVFTSEELEAFHIKPYPSQIYEVTIFDGTLQFKNVSP